MHENLKKAIEIYDKCTGKREDCDTCKLSAYPIPLCTLLDKVDEEFKEAK